MAPEPKTENNEPLTPSAKTLSIEIESSYPLISAMAHFFRDQKKPRQCLELCRLGLNLYPGDMGLRLKSALAYLDLQETGKAWAEIKTVVAELNRLAPDLDLISHHPRAAEEKDLARWLLHLAQILFKDPDQKSDTPTDQPSSSTDLRSEATPGKTEAEGKETLNNSGPQSSTGFLNSPAPEAAKHPTEPGTEAEGGNNILPTLNGWLTQLKGSRA